MYVLFELYFLKSSTKLLGSKDLGSYVFRTLMCIVGKPWSKQDV